MYSKNPILHIAALSAMAFVSGYHLGPDIKREINTLSLSLRDPPTGWSLHVDSGNAGGGCYDDSPTARILNGYGASDSGNRLDICLSVCQGKGFKYAGVQFGTECYVSFSIQNGLAILR